MTGAAPIQSEGLRSLTLLMQLEQSARRAQGIDALRFVIVNETRRLIEYRQAALLEGTEGRLHLTAASGVAVVARDAPLNQWLEDAAASLPERDIVQTLTADSMPDPLRVDWGEFSAGQVLWLPLRHPDGSVRAYLWLDRASPWKENEKVLLERLGDAYAHALAALTPPRSNWRARLWRRKVLFSALMVLIAIGLIPVRQSALAPAEVVPLEPLVVSAPLEGVIAEVMVEPNQPVREGQPLFRFEDVALRSRYEVAEKTLAVAQAEARAAEQGAFEDRRSNARLAMLRTQVDLRAAERDYAGELLGRVTVTAPRNGVAVFRDPNDWVGRPVEVGQRVMLLADPARVELRADLPVGGAIVLDPGAEVRLFLDAEPLSPREARVRRASYEAEANEQGILAYRVTADFADTGSVPRIGLQGTAKLYGADVPLYFHLLRRPIAAARQYLGW